MCVTSVYAQNKLMSFFPDLTHANYVDTIPSSDFRNIVEMNLSDFNQAYFDYGYEDSSKWELVSKNILAYPEIGRPTANFMDLNKDGTKDIILSFRGGNYYTRVLIYFAEKDGYKNVYYDYLVLFGVYKNGDLCLRHPACCTDPTDEFHRVSVDENGVVNKVDSLSISYDGFLESTSLDSLFYQKEWLETTDTLYAVSTMEGISSYGGYYPGSQIRVIDEIIYEGDTIWYCEIRGGILPHNRRSQLFPHSYAWLSKKKY